MVAPHLYAIHLHNTKLYSFKKFPVKKYRLVKEIQIMKSTTMDETKYRSLPEAYSRRSLNSLYREIPLSDATFRLLRKYFNAAANLYGIIPLKKVYEIILSQNEGLITEKEFLAFAEIARHEDEDYCILSEAELYIDGKKKTLMESEIIDITLIDEKLDNYHEILNGQHGKPYYIPPKKEFLAYNDPFYYEKTKSALVLREFLLEKTSVPEDKLETVFIDIYYSVHCLNAGLSDVMARLNKMGLVFNSKNDATIFADVFTAFHNNVRMQFNRGYTPNEIAEMTPQEERVPQSLSLGPNIRQAIADGTIDADRMIQEVMKMDMPNESLRISILKEIGEATQNKMPQKKTKVGRNDPCPCGSGKKYKHCCGK